MIQYVHMNPNHPKSAWFVGCMRHLWPLSSIFPERLVWLQNQHAELRPRIKATTLQPLPGKNLRGNLYADISISLFKTTPLRGSTNGTLAVGRGAF